MSFLWPWVALLLPLPIFIHWFWPQRQSSQNQDIAESVLFFPAIGTLEQAYLETANRFEPNEFFRQVLMYLLWALSVLALMQPQILERHTQINSRGYDLMLAVDVSRSMLALDFTEAGRSINRMSVVKSVVGRFIQARQGDRIGLILFGEAAYMQAPLTQDREAVRHMLMQATATMAGNGTAIGDAIGLAVKKLKQRPFESRILLLLTDGENTAGSLQPSDATRLAKQYGIRIYTIGVGSLGDNQGKVDFPDQNGRISKQSMKLDESLLIDIANITGGRYFRATDAQVLQDIYQQINTLEKTDIKRKSVLVPEPLYRWPLGAAMLVMVLLAGQALGRGGKW